MTNDRLKLIRKSNRLSQYELARRVGTYQCKIWLIENGYYLPDEREKKAIADTLRVNIADIF